MLVSIADMVCGVRGREPVARSATSLCAPLDVSTRCLPPSARREVLFGPDCVLTCRAGWAGSTRPSLRDEPDPAQPRAARSGCLRGQFGLALQVEHAEPPGKVPSGAVKQKVLGASLEKVEQIQYGWIRKWRRAECLAAHRGEVP